MAVVVVVSWFMYFAEMVKIKLSLCFLNEHHAMKAYWGVET
jgi:hypothetical protein